MEAVLDEADELHQPFFLGGIHAGGGFVEQEQLGPGGEGADDFEPPLVAVGQGFGGFVAHRAEVEDAEQFVHLAADYILALAESPPAPQSIRDAMRAMHLRGGADVVGHAHGAEQADVLKGAGDAELGEMAGTQLGDGRFPELDAANGRLIDSGDEIEHRGLARAVGAD